MDDLSYYGTGFDKLSRKNDLSYYGTDFDQLSRKDDLYVTSHDKI